MNPSLVLLERWALNSACDSTLFLYLFHRHHYLQRACSDGEKENLLRQMVAICSVEYGGRYSSAIDAPIQKLVPVDIQHLCELQGQRTDINRPIPGIPRSGWNSAIWSIWYDLYDRPLTERERYVLMCYRSIFWSYIQEGRIDLAHRVYLGALDMKERELPIQVMHPTVLRHIMKPCQRN